MRNWHQTAPNRVTIIGSGLSDFGYRTGKLVFDCQKPRFESRLPSEFSTNHLNVSTMSKTFFLRIIYRNAVSLRKITSSVESVKGAKIKHLNFIE